MSGHSSPAAEPLHPAPGLPLLPHVKILLLATVLYGLVGLYPAVSSPIAPDSENWRQVVLNSPVTWINDGDTFEADLNKNGRLEFPRERIRLLYVDTPELHKSPKGKDLKHGLPARDFLASALERLPLKLSIPRGKETGNYGRTLAIVEADGENINLGLIRRGHSFFQTRYDFPENYERYATAEGKAFDERLGIWADAASRKKYLRRLKWERKTPAGKSNRLFHGPYLSAGRFDPQPLLGRYIRLKGRILRLESKSKGVRVVILESQGNEPLRAVAFSKYADRLGVQGWRPGLEVHLEGFLKVYRSRPELIIHFGRPMQELGESF